MTIFMSNSLNMTEAKSTTGSAILHVTTHKKSFSNSHVQRQLFTAGINMHVWTCSILLDNKKEEKNLHVYWQCTLMVKHIFI